MRMIGDGLCMYCKNPTGKDTTNGDCEDVCNKCALEHKVDIKVDNDTRKYDNIHSIDYTIRFLLYLPFWILQSIVYNIRNKLFKS